MAARIDGASASLDEAILAAAALLNGARQPLVAGLGADVAGVSAAIELARRLRGVADHAGSAVMLRDLDVMRRSGWIITTPLEARARADVVLLAGPGLERGREGLDLLLEAQAPRFFDSEARRVIRLCPEGGCGDLVAQLGLIRMLLAGRTPDVPEDIRETAAALRAARYGVVVWSAAHLDGAAVEMLCGLVEALNANTRCAGLPLAGDGNAAGAAQAAAWLTGYPFPVGFGRGFAEHDPWRFDSSRLVESGEADAALWIMSLSASAPPWTREPKLVALVPAGAESRDWVAKAQVAITVARPGVEHDAVLYDARLGGLAARKATAPARAPSVADVIGAIMAALPSC